MTTNKPTMAIKDNNPDQLIGSIVTVKGVTGVVGGWRRTDTSYNGQRYGGFNTWYTELALDLENDRSVYVTLVTQGNF